MIERDLAPRLRVAAQSFPAVTLTGPRQSGKSTLCRAEFPDHAYVSLEAPDTRDFALEDPRGFLAQFEGGAILDEIQRAPELPSYLQPLIDEDPAPGRWILTGSQNLGLLESVSQSLAGRTAVLHLLPLTYQEIQRFDRYPESLEEAVFTGGYPRLYDQHLPPAEWLGAYVATYIDRDVRAITRIGDLTRFQRFVELCAGRTSQLANLSQLASDAGVSQPTAKSWLSVLEAGFLCFQLPAYSGNLRKRLVKMPKLHFYDTGLACWLLGIREPDQLRSHPLRGPLFETWVVSEIVKARTNRGERGGLSFYRDQHGLEADLLIERPSGVDVIEIKAGRTASGDMLSPARRIAEALSVEHARPVLCYGGDEAQSRSDAEIRPWRDLGLGG